MAVSVRARRLSHLFDDAAKARLIDLRQHSHSYGSSGSEHEAECQPELVFGFLEEAEDEDDAAVARPTIGDDDSDSDRVDSATDFMDEIESVVRNAVTRNLDSYERLLRHHVAAAEEAFSCLRSDKAVFMRRVMVSLREIGHNAAICKTRWSSSGGLTAGSHEFIDVIQPPRRHRQQEPIRYLIDLDFTGEFEVARPTEQYTKLLEILPAVFVGRSDELKRISRAMCAAAKRSLKSRGLSLPPWKKNRYMQNKWLGPYRRTVNPNPAGSVTPARSDVKCRAVGFNDGIGGSMSVRTR